MALDTAAELAAAAHVKRPGRGVTPGAYGTGLGAASIAWSFAEDLTPVVGGGGITSASLGTIATAQMSDQADLGGRGSFA